MVVLATGANKVRSLRQVLGGTPPKTDTKAVRALNQIMRQQAEKRRAVRREMTKILNQAQAPYREQFKNDPRIADSLKELRRILERRSKEQAPKHMRIKVEPQITAGSGFQVNVPPYDVPVQGNNGTPANVYSDVNSGDYGFGINGGDGGTAAWAGVGSWFFALSDDPQQRTGAYLQWNDSWIDSSTNGYTAHNDMDTAIWVWGNTEQTWVIQTGGFNPHWSDGTGWFSTDGSAGGSGNWEGGTEGIETFFPVTANQWYLVVVWSSGSVDDDSGFFGFSYADSNINARVPYIVFGGL